MLHGPLSPVETQLLEFWSFQIGQASSKFGTRFVTVLAMNGQSEEDVDE